MKRFRIVLRPGARALYAPDEPGDFECAQFYNRYAPGRGPQGINVAADAIESIEVFEDGLGGLVGEERNLFTAAEQVVAEDSEPESG